MKRNLLLLAALAGLSLIANLLWLLTDVGEIAQRLRTRAGIVVHGLARPAKPAIIDPRVIAAEEPQVRGPAADSEAHSAAEPAASPMAPAKGDRAATAVAPASEDRPAPSTRGMTWGVVGVLNSSGKDVSSVGCHGRPPLGSAGRSCNAYAGDTPCDQALPMLCLQSQGLPDPDSAHRTERNGKEDFYNGWTGARMALSPPLRGDWMWSAAAADGLCAAYFGPGWMFAEFHDGGGGWGFRGVGPISNASRFWVSINDQPANCWNSSAAPASRPNTGVAAEPGGIERGVRR